MTGADDGIDKLYARYEQENQEYMSLRVSDFREKSKFFLSVAFFSHYGFLIFGLVKLLQLIYSFFKANEGFTATGIFGSMLMVVWICAGIYLWFSDDDNCRTPWITNVSDWTTNIFSNKLKMKNLKENKKEREKFLKFYSLMKSDPDFKKAYLEMSK